MPPEAKPNNTRTSEPSGPTLVRLDGSRMVANALMSFLSLDFNAA
jgi:hypothetical protein